MFLNVILYSHAVIKLRFFLEEKKEDERNMDSLLMSAIEENENLQKKIISLKIERGSKKEGRLLEH